MIALVLSWFLIASGQSPHSVGQEVADLAHAKAPDAKWSASVLVGDLTGDGIDDYVIMGSEGSKVVVAVVVGPKSAQSRVVMLSFGVGDHAQSSFCERPTQFALNSADFDPVKDADFEEPWVGFVRSAKSKIVEIGGDGCDPFLLYWNHEADALDWHRH